MARAIDADALIEHIKDLPTWGTAVGGGLYATKYPKGMFDCEDVISSIENAPTIEAEPVKQDWISVKDRLPEEKVKVLVALGSNIRGKRVCIDQMVSGNWQGLGCLVTHWMPLPDLPENE